METYKPSGTRFGGKRPSYGISILDKNPTWLGTSNVLGRLRIEMDQVPPEIDFGHCTASYK
jgi:hypothetical protein